MDVGGEIYAPQNFDSVSVAKEYVRAQGPSFAAIGRDPSVHFNSSTRLAKRRFRTPLTSILFPQAGRGGPISAYIDLAPGQVVENVQATLQQLGYYHGS